MKIIIIPDIHGSHEWRKVKNIPESDYDFAVFLGDYFDDLENEWPDQGNNAKEIFDWVRAKPSKRKALIGNHDFSYISASRDGSNVSGHQYNKSKDIRKIILGNYDIIDLLFEIDGWVISHAGVTNRWVSDVLHYLHMVLDKWPEDFYKRTEFSSKEEHESFIKNMSQNFKPWDESEFSTKFLNDYWHRVSHNLGDDNCHVAFEELLDWRGFFSSTGDEPMNSCLWVRPGSLLEDAYYSKQIVGHTQICIGEPVKLKSKKCNLVICDSRNRDIIQIFDTEEPGDDFITYTDWQRNTKKIEKTLNNILSQKIIDINKINDMLLNVGVKKEILPNYVQFLRRYDSFKG